MIKIAYTTAAEVRKLIPLSTSEIADADVTNLITIATAKLNAEINMVLEEEKVEYISNEKENTIDGSNKTFYTKNYPIGDLDNDGDVDKSDIEVYSISSSGTRTSLTVETLDSHSIGKFTLTTAPASGDSVYLKYAYCPKEEYTPHALIKYACTYLAAAMAVTKAGSDNFKSISLGKLRFDKFSPEYKTYMDRYYELVNQIMEDIQRRKGKSLIEMAV